MALSRPRHQLSFPLRLAFFGQSIRGEVPTVWDGNLLNRYPGTLSVVCGLRDRGIPLVARRRQSKTVRAPETTAVVTGPVMSMLPDEVGMPVRYLRGGRNDQGVRDPSSRTTLSSLLRALRAHGGQTMPSHDRGGMRLRRLRLPIVHRLHLSLPRGAHARTWLTSLLLDQPRGGGTRKPIVRRAGWRRRCSLRGGGRSRPGRRHCRGGRLSAGLGERRIREQNIGVMGVRNGLRSLNGWVRTWQRASGRLIHNWTRGR